VREQAGDFIAVEYWLSASIGEQMRWRNGRITHAQGVVQNENYNTVFCD
jgi:hypothetical protein